MEDRMLPAKTQAALLMLPAVGAITYFIQGPFMATVAMAAAHMLAAATVPLKNSERTRYLFSGGAILGLIVSSAASSPIVVGNVFLALIMICYVIAYTYGRNISATGIVGNAVVAVACLIGYLVPPIPFAVGAVILYISDMVGPQKERGPRGGRRKRIKTPRSASLQPANVPA